MLFLKIVGGVIAFLVTLALLFVVVPALVSAKSTIALLAGILLLVVIISGIVCAIVRAIQELFRWVASSTFEDIH